MLTGSFAANYYTVPRMTRDADIVIGIHNDDVNQLIHLFQKDFYIDRESIITAIKHQSMFNIIHNESVFKIDFITRKNDLYRRIEFQRKCRVQIDGTPIWIVAPEDLIISKLYWAKDSFSEMQLKDINNLFSSLKLLDISYIEEWVEKLQLNEVYKRLNGRHNS